MSGTKLQPTKCAFQQCTDYVDIARRSSARRRQTGGWEKQAILTMCQYLLNCSRYVQSYY